MARVLVVDDAVFMRRMVADVLADGGHEVVGEAADGHEAIARYQELDPEVTTLDITMPELDGISALKAILELDPARPRDHVLGAGPGEQGARGRQGGGARLRRQAVPGRARARGRRQGTRLAGTRHLLLEGGLGWDGNGRAPAARPARPSPSLPEGLAQRDLAVDLGTANTLVYERSRGIVVSEPSVVAVDSASGEVYAVGSEAHRTRGMGGPEAGADTSQPGTSSLPPSAKR